MSTEEAPRSHVRHCASLYADKVQSITEDHELFQGVGIFIMNVLEVNAEATTAEISADELGHLASVQCEGDMSQEGHDAILAVHAIPMGNEQTEQLARLSADINTPAQLEALALHRVREEEPLQDTPVAEEGMPSPMNLVLQAQSPLSKFLGARYALHEAAANRRPRAFRADGQVQMATVHVELHTEQQQNSKQEEVGGPRGELTQGCRYEEI